MIFKWHGDHAVYDIDGVGYIVVADTLVLNDLTLVDGMYAWAPNVKDPGIDFDSRDWQAFPDVGEIYKTEIDGDLEVSVANGTVSDSRVSPFHQLFMERGDSPTPDIDGE